MIQVELVKRSLATREFLPKITLPEVRSPEVILDMTFESGLLFFLIKNIGTSPALKIQTRFGRKINGCGGSLEISGLNIFRQIEFLGPQREIKIFLDSSASYFSRKQPSIILATLTYRDTRRKLYVNRIRHNLNIYRDLPHVQRPDRLLA